MYDVALVAMPFGPLMYPSIGLSLLQPAVKRRGFSSKTFYFLIDYAERVGLRFYNGICLSRMPPLGKLPGEWIFSGELFDHSEEDVQRYVDDILRTRMTGVRRMPRPIPESVIAKVVHEHRTAGEFLDQCVEKILRERPRIVGLTSTFQQHAPSLALAKRIKAASPDTFIAMGGANCENVMGAETVRQFPFVDVLVSGEGDITFPEIVRRVMAGEALDKMPGVRTPASVARDFAEGRIDNTPPVIDLDVLPENDYDDYLERFNGSRFFRGWQPRLLYETSRGCWWGERMHCTFCGLNGSTMQYRSKSPQRALHEMQSFSKRYPGYDVDVTDNILDLGYFDTVLPELGKLHIKGMDLFYETKANLKKHQVRLIRDAHITRIQPGIESLSDAVLKLMRKGVTALQNIQLLKWCKELGVRVQWNLLCGFPGEPPAEYERMTRMLPLLSHLEPADFMIPIRMDRFSPNFFDAQKLGFTDVRPFEAYHYVYNLPDDAIRNMACFFRFGYQQPQDVDSYAMPLKSAFIQWRRTHGRSALFSIDTADHLIIWDLRPVSKQLLTVLSGLERNVYLACDGVQYGRQLAANLGCREEDIETATAPLIERGLMLRDGDRMLSLAIPLGEYSPPPEIVDRFRRVVRSVGDVSSNGITIRWNGPGNGKTVAPAERRRQRAPRARRLTPSQFAIDRDYVVLQ